MDKQLEGKVVVVTGAARGIGAAIARAMAEAGAAVAVTDLKAADAQKVADEIGKAGGQAMGLEMDVTDEQAVDQGFDLIAKTYGGIDVLVSNAGIQIVKPIDEFDFDSWKKLMAVHVDGGFLTSRAAVRHMKRRKADGRDNEENEGGRKHKEGEGGRENSRQDRGQAGGRGGVLIYMGSVHSHSASPLKCAYVAAKHALLGLARVVAIEGAKHNLRTHVICPGFVRTELVEKQIPEQAQKLGISEEEVVQDVMLNETVDGEFTTKEDVARTAVFLAAFPSAALTGQSVMLSHGWTMR